MSTSSIGAISSSSNNEQRIDPQSVEQTEMSIIFPHPQSQNFANSESAGETELEQPTPAFLMADIWADGMAHIPFDNMTAPASPAHNDNLDMSLIGFLSTASPSHLGIDTSESAVRLLINFMDDSFSRQYTSSRTPSTLQKSWLLYIMLRSSTFYNTSLSMSAYYLYLNESSDSNARDDLLKEYYKYRDLALKGFESLGSTLPSIHGGELICGIHIALLEAHGKNMRSCHSYLQHVAQFFLEYGDLLLTSLMGRQRRFSSPMISNVLPPTPDTLTGAHMSQPSPLELEAAIFFAVKLIWNDILCSAVEKMIPCCPGIYRKFLSNDEFSSSFKDITGCETWIMTAIMDVIALEQKKTEQSAQGNLSIRELASEADKIERSIEREMEKLSNSINMLQQSHGELSDNVPPHYLIQTLIFGYAVLIYLNTIVSGPLTGVPEIHQNISRTMVAWKMLRPAMNPRYLAWAYSTSASLATGSQREAFQDILARMSQLDIDQGSLREFILGVEECWREADKHSGNCNIPCDWRDVHKRANLNILFV